MFIERVSMTLISLVLWIIFQRKVATHTIKVVAVFLVIPLKDHNSRP